MERVSMAFGHGSDARRSALLVGASWGLLALTLSTGVGRAQSAAPEVRKSDQLGEVVVTARYRRENLQKAPIAITAISSSQLESRAMTGISDVAAAAPSVELTPDGGGMGKAINAFIRGSGQSDSIVSSDPGVGMYMDGVYLGTMFGSQMALGDVEDVQILRGPQGTLFGKNSEGGAVLINNVQPKGDNAGFIEVGYGSYNRTRVRAAYDTTLIPDHLFMRVFGAGDEAGGYVGVADYVCSHPSVAGHGTIGLQANTNAAGCNVGDEGSINQRMARIAFKLLATPDLTFNLSAQIARDDGSNTPDVPLIIDPTYPGQLQYLYNTNVLVPAFGIGLTQALVSKNPYVTYTTFTDPLTGHSIPNVSSANTQDVTLRGDWKLGDVGPLDNMLLTSISGYHESDGQYVQAMGGPVTMELTSNLMKSTQYSEELRLNGDSLNKRFEWTVGGYYFQNNSLLSGQVDVPGQVFGLGSYGLNFGQNDPEEDRNASVFVHTLTHITSKLSLEAGLRYSYNSKSYRFNRPLYQNPDYGGSSSLFDPAVWSAMFGYHNVLFPSTSATSVSYRSDPKVGLQYQITPAAMVYAQYSTGFKAGGVNGRPVFLSDVLPFAPEVVTAYEVGAKAGWLDNRLRTNLALYYNNISQMQLAAIEPGIPGNIILNAGAATVKGAELEIDARPTPNMVINASGDMMDFQYTNLGDAGASALNPGGIHMNDQEAGVPKTKLDVGVQYSIDMKKYGSWTPRIDYMWQSSVQYLAQNTPLTAQGDYGLTNLHLIYNSDDGKWKAQLDVLNATNTLYYLFKFGGTLASNGFVSGTPGEPRTFLLTLKRNL